MSSHKPIFVATLTVSDRCSRNERTDESGPRLAALMTAQGWEIKETDIVPDEKDAIQDCLLGWCDRGDISIILTTGGTGLSPRDVTPASTREILDKELPGIGELIRRESQQLNPFSCLSQAIAGVRKNTLIINLPGNPNGAEESLKIVIGLLPHAIQMMAGEAHIEQEKSHAHSH